MKFLDGHINWVIILGQINPGDRTIILGRRKYITCHLTCIYMENRSCTSIDLKKIKKIVHIMWNAKKKEKEKGCMSIDTQGKKCDPHKCLIIMKTRPKISFVPHQTNLLVWTWTYIWWNLGSTSQGYLATHQGRWHCT